MTTFLLPLIVGVLLGALVGYLACGYRMSTTKLIDESAHPHALREQLAPIGHAVNQLGAQLSALEKNQLTTQSSLSSQVQAMTRTSHKLSDRADKLVNALHSPQVRGRWGEIQLERVVELGGMMRHCDFNSQVSVRLGDRLLRPDLVVHLSGGRNIIVDAKVPFSAYLDAMEAIDPEEQGAFMRRHAHQLRNHITQLSAKPYTEAFDPTPEFVVAFVPADPFLDAALDADPELIEYALSRNIVLATPTTLFALLRTVALGWRHEDVTARTKEVQRLARELHQRLRTFGEHYAKIGSSLDKAVEAYNSSLGSLDSRVLVTARRLEDMNVVSSHRSVAHVDPIDARPRSLPNDLHAEPGLGSDRLYD